MKMFELGQTGLKVSELCLGTMTYGTQTSEEDAHRQIDLCLSNNINFIDTAEMYPVNPISAETVGRSEEIIGRWISKNKTRRSDFILATKHSGKGLSHVRNGAPITKDTIQNAVEGSLKRLNTDYIDLYQFHWPNRGSYMFRQNWKYDPSRQDKKSTLENMYECLVILQKQVDKGNIRYFGLSNESAWGTANWLKLSEQHNLPRVATIQNEYSLLCRLYDTDLAELSVNEGVGLMAFSPLAAGLLTGKYLDGKLPENSRKLINQDLGGRDNSRSEMAVRSYLKIAQEFGLNPIHLALAWCKTRPFMCSSIFGATSVDQLPVILEAGNIELSQDCIDLVNETHKLNPMPY